MWTAIIISLLGILLEIQSADAIRCSYTSSFGYFGYYSCGSNQYCCSTRSCCYYSRGVYSLWYFWFGIFLFFAICSGASGAYYRKRQRIIVRTGPAPVQPVAAAQQTMVVSATATSGYAGYPAPPPPYNQAMANRAPYPTGYNMPPPVHFNNNPQGVTVQHY